MHHPSLPFVWSPEDWPPLRLYVALLALNIASGPVRYFRTRAALSALRDDARFDYGGFDGSLLDGARDLLLIGVGFWLMLRLSEPYSEAGVGWGIAAFCYAGFRSVMSDVPAWTALSLARDRRRRRLRRQEIVVSREGIRFSEDDTGTPVGAAWADAEQYSCMQIGGRPSLTLPSGRRVVQTRRGTFDFTTGIGRWRLLSALIQKRATRAFPMWQDVPEEPPPPQIRTTRTKP